MSTPETCIEVLRVLVRNLSLASASFTLVEHPVGVNWRVQHQSVGEKLGFLEEGLIQNGPANRVALRGSDILRPDFSPGKFLLSQDHVISVSSLVQSGDARAHLALMNLHPEQGVEYFALARALGLITPNMPGYLLSSGRYYHFYGLAILSEPEWLRFLAQFLMPTVIVSPRYIGHCLHRGYATLRLTTHRLYKPELPCVCQFLGDSCFPAVPRPTIAGDDVEPGTRPRLSVG